MNKMDDKFEKLLIKKAKDEKVNCNLPLSFDSKIEETLKIVDRMDNSKKKSLYINKKYLSIAAAFLFIFSLGIIKLSFSDNVEIDNSISLNKENYKRAKTYNMEESNILSKNLYINNMMNLNNVKSININGNKIINKEEIQELINLLNNIKLVNVDSEFKEADLKIEIQAEENYIIYMKENLLLINNAVYEGKTVEVEKLHKEISNLI